MNSSSKPSIFARIRLWSWRIAKTLGILIASYLGIVIAGLYPTNSDYSPPETRIEIFVISNEVHADLVLPITNEVVDWRLCFPESHFPGNVRSAKYVLVGWGDRGFFIETPTWSDLKISTAAHALMWHSDTALHVAMTNFEEWDSYGVRVRISRQQYQALATYVRNTFSDIDPAASHQMAPEELLTRTAACRIDGAHYGQNDAFYEAHGRYHALNTCNSWIGTALRRAGVRVGAWTPLPKSVYLYLPKLDDE